MSVLAGHYAFSFEILTAFDIVSPSVNTWPNYSTGNEVCVLLFFNADLSNVFRWPLCLESNKNEDTSKNNSIIIFSENAFNASGSLIRWKTDDSLELINCHSYSLVVTVSLPPFTDVVLNKYKLVNAQCM